MFFDISLENSVETWTINRPDRLNALGSELGRQLLFQLKRLSLESSKPKALILKAKPIPIKEGVVWISGGDLKELKSFDRQAAAKYTAIYSEICQKLADLPIPVIAAIHGKAIGGGAELALFADLRFASSESSLSFKQLKIGLIPGYGGTRRLKELVGLSLAQRWLLTAATIDASSMRETGLVHGVFPTEEALYANVDALCTFFNSIDEIPLAQQKKALYQSNSYLKEQHIFLDTWGNPAHKAFLSKW